MNDLFGAELFTQSRVRTFVQRSAQGLLAYPDLLKQTKVNSNKAVPRVLGLSVSGRRGCF